MTGALVSFTAMAIAGRQLSTELTTFQILFFRSFVGLVVVLALLHRSGWPVAFCDRWHLSAEVLGLVRCRVLACWILIEFVLVAVAGPVL